MKHALNKILVPYLNVGKIFLCLFCSTVLAHTVQAQDGFPSQAEWNRVMSEGKTTIVLDIDNDSLLLKKDDGFYTSGNHLMVKKTLLDAETSISYVWQIGQDLYTASDIKLRSWQLGAHDHPYAGWLYVGAWREQVTAKGNSLRIGADIGCFGPCAGGEWTQNHLHRLLNQPLPQAWNTQLKQEWGAHLTAAWTARSWRPTHDFDVTPMIKGRIGNIFTNVSTGLVWRLGKLNRLPEQVAQYFFARTEVRFVGHDASLQGGYFSHLPTNISPKRAVSEIEIGYLYRNEKWGLSTSIIRRSNEINELSNGKGAQNFANVQVKYAM